MQNIVLVILLILALALILIVLMQRSEGGGLGIGGGGGNMSGRPPASPLAKVTWVLGATFMVAALGLTVIAEFEAGNSSVLDRAVNAQPAPDGDATVPGLGDDLLPATPQADPTQPPAPEE